MVGTSVKEMRHRLSCNDITLKRLMGMKKVEVLMSILEILTQI